MNRIKNSIRSFSWSNTNLPLTSRRVRVILSHPDDSRKLVKAIREQRRGNDKASFTVSEEVQTILSE